MKPEPQIIKDLYTQLMRSPLRTFPALREKLNAPGRGGVYVVYNPQGEAVHVGRTTRGRGGIAKRLRDHMADASSFTTQYLKGDGGKLRGRYTYRALAVRNRRHPRMVGGLRYGRSLPTPHWGWLATRAPSMAS